MMTLANNDQTRDAVQPLLQGSGLTVLAPSGRVLIDDLNLSLSTDKIAIIGRNGVGKSTLLQVLAGDKLPDAGEIARSVKAALVPQHVGYDARALLRGLGESRLPTERDAIVRELRDLGLPDLDELEREREREREPRLSRGEMRKLALLAAKHGDAGLLLLDEPGEDLDSAGKAWLVHWLRRWQGGLVVVSHDARLLREFQHFFVVAESGCRYLPGTYTQLEATLERERSDGQRRYVRDLNMLIRREERNALVRRRRLRKKNGGRVREIDRAPSRAMLNTKRSYAQKYQGKREKVREDRIDAARAWAKATRRALAVELSIDLPMPVLPPDDGHNNVSLTSVGVVVSECVLFDAINLQLRRQRVAVTGPNGAGKTHLLNVMLGNAEPTTGRATRRRTRIGSIAQGGADWMVEDSLLRRLVATRDLRSADDLARLLVGHKFPLALAERPLRTLSPGERVRAALLCLFAQSPTVELLILDEPTNSLDFVGAQSLRDVLAAWQGGLVVASHDRDFLDAIGIDQTIALGAGGAAVATPSAGPDEQETL